MRLHHDDEPEVLTAPRELAGVLREAKLELRNYELRMILDTVDQGFLTVQLDGLIRAERSAILERWLGPIEGKAYFWDVVERIDARERARTRLAWVQLSGGLLPLVVAIDQLPKRLNRRGQNFELAYYPVEVDATLQSFVVVLTDVTQAVERQRAVFSQRSFAILVERLIHDRRGFVEFWNEASQLMALLLGDARGVELRRALHTLKGSLSFLELSEFAATCHRLESALAERKSDGLTPDEIDDLRADWGGLADRIQPLLQKSERAMDVSRADYDRLVQAVLTRRPYVELGELTLALSQQPLAWRLQAAKQHIERVAAQLGKAQPQISVTDHNVRLPPGSFSAFWNALIHVLNNAADHGIEPDDVRRAAGKAVPARVALEASVVGSQLVVEVRDDGPGVAWESLRARAKANGLPHQSQEELVQAMFSDGVSSRTSASGVSGRGAGLSAVRATVRALGGDVSVVCPQQGGTTWRFHLPLTAELREPPVWLTSDAVAGTEGSAVLPRLHAGDGAPARQATR